MKAMVNKDRCKECGLYIHHCPRKTISKYDALNANSRYPVQVDDEACIVCGMRYITCLDGAFHVSGDIEGEAKQSMAEIMKDNEAIAEAAVRAGVEFYAGCPITLSSETMGYLPWRLPEVGGSFVQAESEPADINMVTGVAAPGARALTASSGPGISLKQEDVSTLSDEGLSVVVTIQVRYGNGLGALLSAQCDYNRETRGDGHGDYRCLVLAPASVQEFVGLMRPAYELVEKYRVVSVVMGEATLGQMTEPATSPNFVEAERTPWALNGYYIYKKIGIFERDSMKEAVELVDKYNTIRENEQRQEGEELEDVDHVFVSYGTPGRSTLGAVRELRAQGEKVGIIRLITVWPFPEKAFHKINPNVKGIITVEANTTGQLVDDAVLYTKKALRERSASAYALTYVFGMPTIRSIRKDYLEARSGSKREVY